MRRAAGREGDTVARLGADAYRVLAADLARPEDAADVAEKIRDSLHAPVLAAGREAQVTASIGASVYPRDGEGFDPLLCSAKSSRCTCSRRSRWRMEGSPASRR